ncbi:hypothetical protein SAMN05421687_105232 [Salimicrobium flavidum]|uniref:Uncharacterized protein n=1 Tax=Salimicrobium flavidum TaxID=570947 RepID=A0A1N7JFV2_9BACI|nr:hypothetical protein SAMN05421687_105232 [Salimicrobium flavidum]
MVVERILPLRRRDSALLFQRDQVPENGAGSPERLYERERERQERPPTGTGPDLFGGVGVRYRKTLSALRFQNGITPWMTVRGGSPERLYERQREKAGNTTDGRGTRTNRHPTPDTQTTVYSGVSLFSHAIRRVEREAWSGYRSASEKRQEEPPTGAGPVRSRRYSL